MTVRAKSILIVVGTLLVGVIIGALGTGALLSHRMSTLQALRAESGLVRYLEDVIEPVDEAQREEIRSILEAAARQQMEMRRYMYEQNRAFYEEMRTELGRILTEEQKARLRAWAQRERRDGPRFRPPRFLRGPNRRMFDRPGLERRFPPDSGRFRRRVAPPRSDSTAVDSIGP